MKTFVCILALLVGSFALAAVWTGLSMRPDLGLTKNGLPVRYTCPERVAGTRGVALHRMKALKRAIQAVKKHVSRVEISVDEAADAKARYEISLRMNSGSRVVTRGTSAAWNGLDRELAREVDRCLGEFMAMRQQGDLGPQIVELAI